ncbi:hypothetical protein AB6A40_005096 [Gnathostoma spinigerum]|uniref:Uncharacterized protein n=1 Tax=Gnathostoma spinigerum TaxID=75299 RepID=A0ABD6EGN0_9BILA
MSSAYVGNLRNGRQSEYLPTRSWSNMHGDEWRKSKMLYAEQCKYSAQKDLMGIDNGYCPYDYESNATWIYSKDLPHLNWKENSDELRAKNQEKADLSNYPDEKTYETFNNMELERLKQIDSMLIICSDENIAEISQRMKEAPTTGIQWNSEGNKSSVYNLIELNDTSAAWLEISPNIAIGETNKKGGASGNTIVLPKSYRGLTNIAMESNSNVPDSYDAAARQCEGCGNKEARAINRYSLEDFEVWSDGIRMEHTLSNESISSTYQLSNFNGKSPIETDGDSITERHTSGSSNHELSNVCHLDDVIGSRLSKIRSSFGQLSTACLQSKHQSYSNSTKMTSVKKEIAKNQKIYQTAPMVLSTVESITANAESPVRQQYKMENMIRTKHYSNRQQQLQCIPIIRRLGFSSRFLCQPLDVPSEMTTTLNKCHISLDVPSTYAFEVECLC